MNSEELQKLKLSEQIAREYIHRYPVSIDFAIPTPTMNSISKSGKYLKNAITLYWN